MIKTMLETPDINERLQNAIFLGQLGETAKAIAALDDLADTENVAIRERARRMLSMMKNGEQLP